jgi:hypothetical protein
LSTAIITMNDNMKRLEARTVAAAEAALAARKVVTAIDVLQGIGWLPQARVDEWRQGRLAYLEGGVSTNLHKISAVMRMFRRWAQSRGLAPRETAYVSRTRDHHPLRFSKSGALAIERAYRTHWVSPELSEAQREQLVERQGRAPDLVVISPLSDWTCSTCGASGDFLLMDITGPLCRHCAKLDHLVYLAAGDAALSRRAKRASGLSAIVVRFSRSRKRYERQGILIEEAALKQAEAAADDAYRRADTATRSRCTSATSCSAEARSH